MNVIAIDSCRMHKKSREYIDHFLLHCEIAREFWSSLFLFFFFSFFLCVIWGMPRRLRELLVSWRGQIGNRHALEV